MTKKKFKEQWLTYFCEFTEEEISAMVLGVNALRIMEVWPSYVEYCVAKLNEDMDNFTNQMLEDFDEDSVTIQ